MHGRPPFARGFLKRVQVSIRGKMGSRKPQAWRKWSVWESGEELQPGDGVSKKRLILAVAPDMLQSSRFVEVAMSTSIFDLIWDAILKKYEGVL